MGDKWLSAKFDKDMNSMKQKLQGPFKNIQVAGSLIPKMPSENDFFFTLKNVRLNKMNLAHDPDMLTNLFLFIHKSKALCSVNLKILIKIAKNLFKEKKLNKLWKFIN